MENPPQKTRMTAQKALEVTIVMYKWWEKNVDKALKDWPGWTSNGGTIVRYPTHSLLCEYVADLSISLGCRSCLLTKYWQKMNKKKEWKHIVFTCQASPHEIYYDKIKPKYIRRVREAAERKLKKIMEYNND